MFTSLTVENIRCFQGKHQIPLRPLTLLIGENSTGKSTVLAMYRVACFFDRGVTDAPFNEAPFDLGAFSDICSTQGWQGGKARYFGLGATLQRTTRDGRPVQRDLAENEIRTYHRFESHDGVPERTLARLEVAKLAVTVTLASGATSPFEGEAFAELDGKKLSLSEVAKDSLTALSHRPGLPLLFLTRVLSQDKGSNLDEETRAALSKVVEMYWSPSSGNPHALAPVRTKPERTYHKQIQRVQPEGQHVPMMVYDLLSKHLNTKPGESDTKEGLEEFGKESGLFSEISVRKLGELAADPFQIMVKVGTRRRNIIDVGYGVSQALPIVADTLNNPGTPMLIQQPEVHLHPRAQAALGTFFAKTAALKKNQFLIETHSDYLIDRVRIEVRRGTIKPEDVVFLYFERKGSETSVFPIELDETGNLKNQPSSYREFFIRETDRLLGG